MFPLWLVTIIIFYFCLAIDFCLAILSGYWLWKLITICLAIDCENSYYFDYVTIICLIRLYHDWSTENNTVISLKLQFNRKICNHFLKYRCTYQNYLGGFWKVQVPRYCLFSPKFQMCFWWGAMFKNNCTIWLYDNLLLLSGLFHFLYFIFSAPISFSLCFPICLFFFVLSQTLIKCSRKAFIYI